MQVRDCVEYGYVELDPAELLRPDGSLDVAVISRLNPFTVDYKDGALRLQAGGIVGVVPVNDRLLLRIRPRIPIGNLSRMVERSGHQPAVVDALRSYATAPTTADWMVDFLADRLITLAHEVINSGLYRTYVRRTGSGSSPRGRIDVGPTIRHFAARNVTYRAQYSWFERTVDNPPNRCIRAALDTLHRRYVLDHGNQHGSRKRVRRLSRLLQAFSEASSDNGSHSFLADPVVAGMTPLPASRSYYTDALRTAVAIVTGKGLSLDDPSGALPLESLLLDMGPLFEKYVRTTLQRRAATDRWGISVLDGNKDGALPLYADPPADVYVNGRVQRPLGPAASAVRVTPDVVFRREDGSVPLVAELKNTLIKKQLPDRSEVEQAVTYATRYQTSAVLLVHPKGHGVKGGLQFCGQIGDVAVFDYRYDLNAADMDTEDRLFSDAVASLLDSELISETGEATTRGLPAHP
ncbi:hypothetical protein [Curtobacterium sp. MCPF17_046]|uniref:5-methylcytosine restriction system specificity protein McrC n=1 Tax=Curtobacterium sp. MCPF17_046 TaxID=2175663 RepID=UPI000D9BB985|nr:hypothetical protein [Curtobacterium sp. MCPF17_046]PYY34472.1 hypothetical protein DEJ32_14790 [Curtobacterium sp. MCPF17_046]